MIISLYKIVQKLLRQIIELVNNVNIIIINNNTVFYFT